LTRANLVAERSLLFRIQGLAIDLVAHAGSGSLRFMHGQVVADRGRRPLASAGVRLGYDAEPVEADRHGHFAVSVVCGDGDQLLWIDVPDRQVLCSIPGHDGE
jgi:hypothetical protein